MRVLVTGSSGLVGSACVEHFDASGHHVIGVDSNRRRAFFGPEGDTRWNRERLEVATRSFRHLSLDVTDRSGVLDLFAGQRFDAVIHCAAQPSHDRAAQIPFDDFDTNAVGTLNLLEAARRHAPEAPFVFLSTNKVYGAAPNEIPLRELETRYEYDDPAYVHGVPETLRIDHSKHSLFGASKVAADVMVQEYGRYFGMPTVCLRGGCLTGPAHAGVELHGFLNHLVRVAVSGRRYTIYGYKGKQVRDQIHAVDVAALCERIVESTRPAAVYNLGGGPENSVSVLEAIDLIQEVTGRRIDYELSGAARSGDHICYVSDLRKLRADYPGWEITRSVPDMCEEIAASLGPAIVS